MTCDDINQFRPNENVGHVANIHSHHSYFQVCVSGWTGSAALKCFLNTQVDVDAKNPQVNSFANVTIELIHFRNTFGCLQADRHAGCSLFRLCMMPRNRRPSCWDVVNSWLVQWRNRHNEFLYRVFQVLCTGCVWRM